MLMITTPVTSLQVTLMLDNGDTREDLTLPKGTEESDKLAESIKEQFAAGQASGTPTTCAAVCCSPLLYRVCGVLYRCPEAASL